MRTTVTQILTTVVYAGVCLSTRVPCVQTYHQELKVNCKTSIFKFFSIMYFNNDTICCYSTMYDIGSIIMAQIHGMFYIYTEHVCKNTRVR